MLINIIGGISWGCGRKANGAIWQ